MTVGSLDQTARPGRPWMRLAGMACLALLLMPLALGGGLRGRAAQRHLATGRPPEYQMLPLLALAAARLDAGAPQEARATLDQAWPLMPGFRGPFAERLWLGLAWLEARAGRLDRAREAVASARRLQSDLSFMASAPLWGPFREALGLGGP